MVAIFRLKPLLFLKQVALDVRERSNTADFLLAGLNRGS